MLDTKKLPILGLCLLFLVPVGCKEKNLKADHGPSEAQYDYDADFVRIKEYLLTNVPGLGNTDDPLTIALEARNFVYQAVPLQPTSSEADFFRPWDNFIRSIGPDEYGHACGGLAITYATILRAFGVPNRNVSMFTSDIFPEDSHSAVEIFYDGRWLAMDPTFNASFVDADGHLLSYEDVHHLTRTGGVYSVTSNGYPYLPNRSLAEYYTPLEDMLNYIVSFPAKFSNESGEITEVSESYLPAGFDGGIETSIGHSQLPYEYSIWNIISDVPQRDPKLPDNQPETSTNQNREFKELLANFN